MVFIRRIDERLKGRIDRWWDKSSIPERLRQDYVNSGVFRVSRAALPAVRERCLAVIAGGRGSTFQFHDQDAINLALDGRVDTLSMSWNYPGFLLGTQIADLIPPRIVHFMSNPRPWNAPFRPWGDTYYKPYREFVADNPQVKPYWTRSAGLQRYRYVIQQFVKLLTERRLWESEAAAEAVRELNTRDRVL
jgi:lipopolysaccharide biosynthesis glycosyltransferase